MIRVGNSVFNPLAGRSTAVEVSCLTRVLELLNERTSGREPEDGNQVVGFAAPATAYSGSALWFVEFLPNGYSFTKNSVMVRERIATSLLRLVEKTNADGSPFLNYGQDFYKVQMSRRTRGIQEGDYTYIFNKKWLRIVVMDFVKQVIDHKETHNLREVIAELRRPQQ